MNPDPNSLLSLTKKPSAYLPIAMSLMALLVVLGNIALFGVVHETDEGATAHIWQLLMFGQPPLSAYFVIKWLPRMPRQTLGVVALQVLVALAALTPVYLLGL